MVESFVNEVNIIIVGAGPAGLMAAGQAALSGASVTLFEKKPNPARKLLISGQGRCNITNTADSTAFIGHFGHSGDFLRQAFARFFNRELIAFLEEIGIKTLTEPDGRIFPATERAEDVVDALLNWVDRLGVITHTSSTINDIIIKENHVSGVEVSPTFPSASGGAEGSPPRPRRVEARAVIVSTGGASYPATGSTGDGYKLAAAVGHRIVPIRPALVPLETAGDLATRLQGLTLTDVGLQIVIDGRRVHRRTGDLLFTHFGLSGPFVLSISREVVDALAAGKRVTLQIDLVPGQTEEQLDQSLQEHIKHHGKQQFHNALGLWLPKKMIPVCLSENKIGADMLGNQLTARQRRDLTAWLKATPLEIKGHRPMKEAMVTAGGVDTTEVDPRTMQSRLVSGLYFAGEVLDVDADTGGYNLQAAFSTGWLAGTSAANLFGGNRPNGK